MCLANQSLPLRLLAQVAVDLQAMKDLMPLFDALKSSAELVAHTDLYAQADGALAQWKATAKTCEKRIRETRATSSVKKDTSRVKKDKAKNDMKGKQDISEDEDDF